MYKWSLHALIPIAMLSDEDSLMLHCHDGKADFLHMFCIFSL